MPGASLPCDGVSALGSNHFAHARPGQYALQTKVTSPTSLSACCLTLPIAPSASTLRARFPLAETCTPESAKLEAAAPSPGRLMATHDRPAVPLEDEHEYSSHAPRLLPDSIADTWPSYEALPPNFSLSANMLAGAFAGIAVRLRPRRHYDTSANIVIGALGHVSSRPTQGTQLLEESKPLCGRCANSQVD